MYKVERQQKVMWKLNPTVFEVINRDALYSVSRSLGSSVSATRAMTSSIEEMKAYMPIVTGASPDNSSVNWQNVIESYWHDFSIDISESGSIFDTSLIVEYVGNFKKNIDAFFEHFKIKKADSIEELEKQFGTYLIKVSEIGTKVIPESEVYKYATPANMEHYLAWRYCLVSPEVANKVEDINKSPNIRFYIHDDEIANRRKKETADISKKAFSLYNALVNGKNGADKGTFADILLVYGNFSVNELFKLTLEDCQLEVSRMTVTKPMTLITALEDNLIADKSRILRYINVGILRRIENSEAIIDGTTLATVGANLNDAVAYLLNPDNASYATELKAKFNSIRKLS